MMKNEIQLASSALDEILAVARVLATSGYFDAARTTPEQAVAQLATKILAGREMGYGPFASVQGIHIIQGRPAMSASLMASAVKASPRYDYRVRRLDDTVAEVEFFERRGGGLESLGVSTFTAEDARRAGTQNMNKFPRNMLFARALANGVRWYTPDVFLGAAVYTPEEFDGVEPTAVTPHTMQLPAPAPEPEPEPALPPEVAAWQSPEDAYGWAVGVGAAANVFAARAAFRRIVDEHGGRLTRQNAQEIYLAFYEERRQRAEGKVALPEQAAAQPPEEPVEGLFA